jgi:hypothetical protein
MKLFALLSLTSVVLALPQAVPISSAAVSSAVPPTPVVASSATASSGSPVKNYPGQLPTNGLKGIPWPGTWDSLAGLVGIDPAKATPLPSDVAPG